jgi:hypothetical protein
MAFSLRSPKLSGGPAETPKIFAETPKVSEIPKNLWRLRRFLREMLTSFGDFGYFCGVSGPVLNLTASFCVRSLRRFFGDSRT